jgi:sugar-specific transcriptional regulator TrmB
MNNDIIFVPVSADEYFQARTAALAEQMEALIEKMTSMEKEMNKLSAPTKKRRK